MYLFDNLYLQRKESYEGMKIEFHIYTTALVNNERFVSPLKLSAS